MLSNVIDSLLNDKDNSDVQDLIRTHLKVKVQHHGREIPNIWDIDLKNLTLNIVLLEEDLGTDP